jgi:hypothetical protein
MIPSEHSPKGPKYNPVRVARAANQGQIVLDKPILGVPTRLEPCLPVQLLNVTSRANANDNRLLQGGAFRHGTPPIGKWDATTFQFKQPASHHVSVKEADVGIKPDKKASTRLEQIVDAVEVFALMRDVMKDPERVYDIEADSQLSGSQVAVNQPRFVCREVNSEVLLREPEVIFDYVHAGVPCTPACHLDRV